MEILLTLMVNPFLKPKLSPNHNKFISFKSITHSTHSLTKLLNPNNISFNMSTRDVSSRDLNSWKKKSKRDLNRNDSMRSKEHNNFTINASRIESRKRNRDSHSKSSRSKLTKKSRDSKSKRNQTDFTDTSRNFFSARITSNREIRNKSLLRPQLSFMPKVVMMQVYQKKERRNKHIRSPVSICSRALLLINTSRWETASNRLVLNNRELTLCSSKYNKRMSFFN